jgi:hypothetical protein
MEPYLEKFRVEGGVVHVQLSGKYPNERLASQENLFKPLVEVCQKENCREAIVDARDLQVQFDTWALFRAGTDAASLNEHGLRVALIAREDMLNAFFDDVTYNRAARVHVFTDPQSAQAWIQERRSVEAA